MADHVFQRMLELARERRGWDRAQLTTQLNESKQNLTNWKTRGVPADKYQHIARTIGCTIDELVGSKSKKNATSPVVLHITQADLDALEPSQRETLVPLIGIIQKAVRKVDAPGRPSRGSKS